MITTNPVRSSKNKPRPVLLDPAVAMQKLYQIVKKVYEARHKK